MRFLSYLVTLFLAALMTACGGGGGSAGTITGSDALRTDVPTGLTVVVGNAVSFTIAGGKTPYSVLSNSEGTGVAGVSGSTLTLGAVYPGTVIFTVRDALGAKVTAQMTVVNNALGLFTTAPSGVTLAMGSAGAQSYRVGGGLGPYSVTSSNSNILSAVLVGQSLTLTGIVPGSATATVRDSLGATVNITATVTTVGNLALFSTAPTGLNVAVATTSQEFSIGGGLAPYTATSSNTAVATVSLVDKTFTIRGVTVGSASIVIRDSLNTAITVAVTVPAPAAIYSNAPSNVTIGIGSAPVYTIGGGLAPYTAVSSDSAVAVASLSGTSLTIRALKGGSASIQIRDSLGASLIISVTVPAPDPLFTTAPSPITVAIGSGPTYTVGGGTAPYTATSANTAIATASITSNSTTLTITGVAAGSTNIVVRDAAGATVSIAVTVPTLTSTALFTSAPASVIIPIGSSPVYSVGGGSGTGYTAVSSNTSVATVSAIVSGNLTVTGVASGTASILIRDSAGATVTIAVTVPTVNSQALFTSAPAGGVFLAMGSPQTYAVGGGQTPYFITSNNTAVATISQPTTTTYTITPVSAGSATIQIRDSAIGVLTVPVTVTTSGSVPLATTAPSAVSIAVSTAQPYSVSGGSGTYTITNTNPFNVGAVISGSGPGGGTLTITGLLVGSSTLTLRDGAGGQVVISVNVIQPGSTLALLPATLSIDERNNGAINLTIFGGVAPFQGFTTDSVLAPVSVSGSTLTVGAVAGRCVAANTTVTLTVIDSQGASAISTLSIVDTNAGAGCSP